VNPRYDFTNCPAPDLLVVPGGWGTRQQMNHPPIIDWIKQTAANAELVLSVCTDALLLAKAGLLEGLSATTHHGAIELLRQTAPNTKIATDRRFVDTAGSFCPREFRRESICRSTSLPAWAGQRRSPRLNMKYDWRRGG
jgi:putative intracellular protease/amidase